MATGAQHASKTGGPKAFDNSGVATPPMVHFWNIGEKLGEPIDVQIKPTLFKQMPQLYTHVAGKLQGCGGGVRAVFTTEGKQITSLDQFTQGQDVIAIPNGQKFTKENIPAKLKAKIGA